MVLSQLRRLLRSSGRNWYKSSHTPRFSGVLAPEILLSYSIRPQLGPGIALYNTLLGEAHDQPGCLRLETVDRVKPPWRKYPSSSLTSQLTAESSTRIRREINAERTGAPPVGKRKSNVRAQSPARIAKRDGLNAHQHVRADGGTILPRRCSSSPSNVSSEIDT